MRWRNGIFYSNGSFPGVASRFIGVHVARDSNKSWTNSLGCYGIALALAALVAALAAIGLSSTRETQANEDIPTLPTGE
jgi:hypothetical protein